MWAWMSSLIQKKRLRNRQNGWISERTALVLAAFMLAGIIYASTRPRIAFYGCPNNCLGVEKVESPHAIRTVNLKTGEINEWRFCPGDGVHLYKGFVIELTTTWTGWCYDLNGVDQHYHVVTGSDVLRQRYSPAAAVTRTDCNPVSAAPCNSDSRPVLAKNCRDTADDSSVVCDGIPNFSQETSYAQPGR